MQLFLAAKNHAILSLANRDLNCHVKCYQSLEHFKNYRSRFLENCGKIFYLFMAEIGRLHF